MPTLVPPSGRTTLHEEAPHGRAATVKGPSKIFSFRHAQTPFEGN